MSSEAELSQPTGAGEVIIRLLPEYATKLRQLSEQWSALKQRNFLYLYASLLTLISAVALYLLVQPQLDVSSTTSLESASAVVGALIVMILLPFFYFYVEGRKKIKLLEDNIEVLADQLEALIYRGSEIESHGERKVERRLELALWLADSEQALRYVRYIVLARRESGKS